MVIDIVVEKFMGTSAGNFVGSDKGTVYEGGFDETSYFEGPHACVAIDYFYTSDSYLARISDWDRDTEEEDSLPGEDFPYGDYVRFDNKGNLNEGIA